MRNSAINYILFQFGWFGCVIGAARGVPEIGVLAVAVAVGVHLRMARNWRPEALLMLVAAMLGLLFDSALLATGWVEYPNGAWLPGAAPYWIVAMWPLFATTLNLSMRWMRGHWALAALLGAVGGPLSYLAGAKLGAMTLVNSPAALTALAVAWGVLMPLLAWLSGRWNGFAERQVPGFIQSDWREGEVSSRA